MITGEKLAIRGQGGDVVTPDTRVEHYLAFEAQTHYVIKDLDLSKPPFPARSPVVRTRDL